MEVMILEAEVAVAVAVVLFGVTAVLFGVVDEVVDEGRAEGSEDNCLDDV